MTVDDRRAASVLRGPVPADRQAEVVGLAGRLAIKREVTDLPGPAALHLLLHPCVGHDQVPAVVNVVADQRVQEAHHLGGSRPTTLIRKGLELGQ